VTARPKYFLRRLRILKATPGGSEVHYMHYVVSDDNHASLGFAYWLLVPCRARLHHLLTGLFYDWDWKSEENKEITEEEAMMLKHIFTSQKEYKLWEVSMAKIKTEGTEKARQWLVDQIKILALRNLLKGKKP